MAILSICSNLFLAFLSRRRGGLTLAVQLRPRTSTGKKPSSFLICSPGTISIGAIMSANFPVDGRHDRPFPISERLNSAGRA